MNWIDIPKDLQKALINDFTNICIRVNSNTSHGINLEVLKYEDYKKILSKINLGVARNQRLNKDKLNRSTYVQLTKSIIDTLSKYGGMSIYQLSKHTNLQHSVVKNFLKRDSESPVPKIKQVKHGKATYVILREYYND